MATQWNDGLKDYRTQIRQLRNTLNRIEEALAVAEGDTHPLVELAALSNANNTAHAAIARLSVLMMSIDQTREPLIVWNNNGTPALRLVSLDDCERK